MTAKKNDQQGYRAKNLKNLVIKFGLDQSVGAAGNILFFIVVQGVLNGTPVSGIRQAVIKVDTRMVSVPKLLLIFAMSGLFRYISQRPHYLAVGFAHQLCHAAGGEKSRLWVRGWGGVGGVSESRYDGRQRIEDGKLLIWWSFSLLFCSAIRISTFCFLDASPLL